MKRTSRAIRKISGILPIGRTRMHRKTRRMPTLRLLRPRPRRTTRAARPKHLKARAAMRRRRTSRPRNLPTSRPKKLQGPRRRLPEERRGNRVPARARIGVAPAARANPRRNGRRGNRRFSSRVGAERKR